MAEGRAWTFGDNVDTDVMMPGKYLTFRDLKQVAVHCMESVDPSFAREVQPGDVVVAGRNFGCGSARPAPTILRELGVSCVVAESFGKLFLRNAINLGMPVVECAEAARRIEPGDRLRVDFASGLIENLSRGERYQSNPFPPFLQEIIRAGGLVEWARLEVERRGLKRREEAPAQA